MSKADNLIQAADEANAQLAVNKFPFSSPELLKLSSNGRRVGMLEFSDSEAPHLSHLPHWELSYLLNAAYKVAAREL